MTELKGPTTPRNVCEGKDATGGKEFGQAKVEGEGHKGVNQHDYQPGREAKPTRLHRGG